MNTKSLKCDIDIANEKNGAEMYTLLVTDPPPEQPQQSSHGTPDPIPCWGGWLETPSNVANNLW
eukprot:3489980-Amphidinium_carterae.1